MLTEVLIYVATAVFCFLLWQKYKYNYWQRQNVKFIPPAAIFGNFKGMLTVKQAFPDQLLSLHNAPGFEKEPFVGIYTVFRPALLIRDVELIKRVMIKDFNHFVNRVLRADPHNDSLGSNNMFFIRNPQWRELRSKLSPVFTSGKIKQMYPLMVEVAKELESVLSSTIGSKPVDIKDICSRFTNEMIGTIAFGVRANSLRNANSDFYKSSLEIFKVTFKRAFDFAFVLFIPSLTSLLRVKVFSEAASKFLRTSVKFVLEEREKSGIVRNDLIDTLLAMKKEAETGPNKMNSTEILDFLVAQAALFHTAGFETSSSTMAFALYELAMHPHCQQRLRAEIGEAFENGEDMISYEKIHLLPYLDQVVNETLRKYPVVGFLERECTTPDENKGYSLNPFSDFIVPNGMAVYVSPLGIHHDERYWSEPENFIPERFAPENRSNLNMNAYLPFGIGPRNCIGMRIGLLQTKLGLVHLLKDHCVNVCDKTTKTIQFDPKSIVLRNKGDIFLKVERVH